ncbi:hypothetical protein M8494_11370 [Serratia ureilytica]
MMSAGPAVAILTGIPAGYLVDRFRIAAHWPVWAGGGGRRGRVTVIATAGACSAMLGPIALLTAGYAPFQVANNTMLMKDLFRTARADRRHGTLRAQSWGRSPALRGDGGALFIWLRSGWRAPLPPWLTFAGDLRRGGAVGVSGAAHRLRPPPPASAMNPSTPVAMRNRTFHRARSPRAPHGPLLPSGSRSAEIALAVMRAFAGLAFTAAARQQAGGVSAFDFQLIGGEKGQHAAVTGAGGLPVEGW